METEPATQARALTGNRDLLWDDVQPVIGPYQLGHNLNFLKYVLFKKSLVMLIKMSFGGIQLLNQSSPRLFTIALANSSYSPSLPLPSDLIRSLSFLQ